MSRFSRLLAAAVVSSCALAAPATSLGAIGPDPTVDSLRATAGPYLLNRTAYSDAATPGFGSATVFSPKGVTGRLGVVAFAPGFTENTSSVSWLAQKAASYGFVTIALNVNNTWTDFPTSRATQLLKALDFVTTTAKEAAITDPAREAVAGHSMGGGATLEAARERPSLKATIGLAPWNPGLQFADVTVPSLEIGAQNDFIAPVKANARGFYNSLPETTPKTFLNLSNAGHLATNSPSARVGAAAVAWLKTYVDDDVRYRPFVCGSHDAIRASELAGYASNC